MQDGQPSQVISPGSDPSESPAWQFNPESPAQQNETLPPVAQPTSAPAPQPKQSATGDSGVSWTASEFIAHSKSSSWYLLLMLAAVATTAVVYLLTQDRISAGVVIIVAIIFGISAARKPRELQYSVDERGVHIADKEYPYQSFRSFSVVQEEGIESIWFMPLKRFMPIISIYFAPEDGDKIVDVLNQSLPIEDHKPELVDRLMHRLHF